MKPIAVGISYAVVFLVKERVCARRKRTNKTIIQKGVNMDIASSILSFWPLIILALLVIGYKITFRVFLGGVIIPENKIGLIVKKFVLVGKDKTLPTGRIIATKGEAGMQAQSLQPGIHFFYWVWQYDIRKIDFLKVPEAKVLCLVAKDGKDLEAGKVLARRVECNNFQDAVAFLNNGGQKGRQAAILPTGTYRINTFLFETGLSDALKIGDNTVGIVTTQEGRPLDKDQIAGEIVSGHQNFQDFDAFISGNGRKGLQEQVVLAGTYYWNPWAIKVDPVPMTEIPIGYVGVVISYVGPEGHDLSGTEFKHGNIVQRGEKGIWVQPLEPGKYPVNTFTYKVEQVPTTNIVLNWASARTESHKLDADLSTITVRSKDGFTFNLDVSQIIHIPLTEAPKVIARFGTMKNLVSQVLEPTIGNYFRNSAQKSDVIGFLTSRSERQKEAKEHIVGVLAEYNVTAVDTLIGDIDPPEALMATLTQRKIAEEMRVTYTTQQQAQETRQNLMRQTAIADMQKEVMESEQRVIVAERQAEQVVKTAEGARQSQIVEAEGKAKATVTVADADAHATNVKGRAEADIILAKGTATAEAYDRASKAMGSDNFTRLKVTELIGSSKMQVIPQVLVQGGQNSGSAIDGLLGVQLMKYMGETNGHVQSDPLSPTK
jgi:uncharacterized membrane protein YqiK